MGQGPVGATLLPRAVQYCLCKLKHETLTTGHKQQQPCIQICRRCRRKQARMAAICDHCLRQPKPGTTKSMHAQTVLKYGAVNSNAMSTTVVSPGNRGPSQERHQVLCAVQEPNRQPQLHAAQFCGIQAQTEPHNPFKNPGARTCRSHTHHPTLQPRAHDSSGTSANATCMFLLSTRCLHALQLEVTMPTSAAGNTQQTQTRAAITNYTVLSTQ
jgi:hypothetical protein